MRARKVYVGAAALACCSVPEPPTTTLLVTIPDGDPRALEWTPIEAITRSEQRFGSRMSLTVRQGAQLTLSHPEACPHHVVPAEETAITLTPLLDIAAPQGQVGFDRLFKVVVTAGCDPPERIAWDVVSSRRSRSRATAMR